MDFIEIENNKYEVDKNYKDCFNKEEFLDKVTDYFYEFDYIFGDYAYDKLRLKGFYDSSNKKAKNINDIKYIDSYIKDYCAYGTRYFLLKKIK